MKISITRTNKQNKLCLSTKTTERFLERIAKDDAKQSDANFRMHVPMPTNGYDNYIGMKEWHHVYPAQNLAKTAATTSCPRKRTMLDSGYLVVRRDDDYN